MSFATQTFARDPTAERDSTCTTYVRTWHPKVCLELLLFLFCNREYWNNSRVIDDAIHWDAERTRARRAAEAAADDLDDDDA